MTAAGNGLSPKLQPDDKAAGASSTVRREMKLTTRLLQNCSHEAQACAGTGWKAWAAKA